jgi:cyclomaltodextrinase / maltogenic alpha-amylase / neopullulanase
MLNMKVLLLAIFFLQSVSTLAGSILLDQKDAEVWHIRQGFSGSLTGLSPHEIIIHHNEVAQTLPVTAGVFSVELVMHPGDNLVWVEAMHGDSTIKSQSITYKLMYKPTPIIRPLIMLRGDTAILHADVLQNPYAEELTFYWKAQNGNPAESKITLFQTPTATAVIPLQSGKYYFNLEVGSRHDSLILTTYCERTDAGLKAFSFTNGYSSWINDAIIYEITPYKFVENGRLSDITAKLAEIHSTGVNTIWLQPVFQSSRNGQGYDVVDFLKVNSRLGTEEDLRILISTAKDLGMRVILDIVPNHTSLHHPYAMDVITNGRQSHYYDYYQHEVDGATYSSHYHKHPQGFIYYFWEELVNLNYNNDEVQRWMIEVCKYWVREFGIDGFRFDAIWGVNARKPSFATMLRDELKSINPDLLLLAEDKPEASVYRNGFDAAYDWTMDTTWVSHWSWQYKYDERTSFTVFNHPDTERRVEMLGKAIFDSASMYPRLRFMENNDLPRFINDHSLRQTKMAAALLFSLNGIPMLYNGQEVGFKIHPYSKGSIFERDRSIRSLDTLGLYEYYKELISLRAEHKALRSNYLRKVYQSEENGVVGFERRADGETIFVFINLREDASTINLADIMYRSATRPYRLLNLLSRERLQIKNVNGTYPLVVGGYSTVLLQAIN